jgi:RND family efflux transporter MFP subunit
MNKRKIIITLAGVLILVLSFALSGKIKRTDPPRPAAVAIATAVQAATFEPGLVGRTIAITGRLLPAQTVQLFAEVGGVATYGDKPFKPGVRYAKGEVMVRINSDEARSALYAARSAFQSSIAAVLPDVKLDFANHAPAWENYLAQLRIEQNLAPLPETDDRKLKLFLSGRGIYTTYYQIREAETRLAKFLITAPFDGVLTQAQIDAATLVRVGQPIGEFITTGRFELEAGISHADALALKPGMTFEMKEVNSGASFAARLARINEAIDPATQQVRIYADVNDSAARSGMYLEGRIAVQEYPNAIEVPVVALVNDTHLFAIRDSVATLLPVQVEHKNSKTAIVTGISRKEIIITDRHGESLAGAKVAIVNTAR